MCLNRDTVSDDELKRFADLIQSLPQHSGLRSFLEPMYLAIASGGGICMGHVDGPPEPGDQRPPGIYPPE